MTKFIKTDTLQIIDEPVKLKHIIIIDPPNYVPPPIPIVTKKSLKITINSNTNMSGTNFSGPIFHRFILIPLLFLEYLRKNSNNIEIIKNKFINRMNYFDYNFLLHLIKPWYTKSLIKLPQQLINDPDALKKINDCLVNLDYVKQNKWCRELLREYDNYITDLEHKLIILSRCGNIFLKKNKIQNIDSKLTFYSEKYFGKNSYRTLNSTIPSVLFMKKYYLSQMLSNEYLDEMSNLIIYYDYIEKEIQIYEELLFVEIMNKYFPKSKWLDYNRIILELIKEFNL